ncbi:ORFL100C [Human betaherpesvirus 5]|nr:ORFL100C [Human betaherpesvirus 5]QHX40413.1 ORFL100C [Human betaherpesvirus 5]
MSFSASSRVREPGRLMEVRQRNGRLRRCVTSDRFSAHRSTASTVVKGGGWNSRL